MAARTLRLFLVIALLVAIIPFFPWFAAVLFDSVDDRWLDSLAGLRITLPIALGLAALAFANHGVAMHGELVADLEDNLQDLFERQHIAVATGATAPAMATSVRAPARNGGAVAATVVAEPEAEASLDEATEEKAKKKGKLKAKAEATKKKKVVAAKSKAKFAVRSEMSRQFNKWTP